MNRFRLRLFLAQCRIDDYVKYRSRIPTWLYLLGYVVTFWDSSRRWAFLFAAHRHSYSAYAEKRILRNLPAATEYAHSALVHSGGGQCTRELFYKRAIILKQPIHDCGRLVEKGVLLVTYLDAFAYLYCFFDVSRLLSEYYLVLEPSRSGYALPHILVWRRFPQPVVVQASEQRDRSFLTRLDGNLIVTEMGASDWVDHRVFRPLDGFEKEFDSILVGDGSRAKRVHVYLHAVAAMRDPDYRCALVLIDWGGRKADIQALVDYYGLGEVVTLYDRLPQTELNVLFNKSKVNVLLSLKEGSNRVLFEGLFADVPAILLEENVGVNKNYINQHTGAIIAERDLGSCLASMKDEFTRYNPRAWAMEHISFNRSTQAIATMLAEAAEKEGLAFTQPLYEKVNVPEVNYAQPSDRTRHEEYLTECLDDFAVDSDRPTPASDWTGRQVPQARP